jgi:glycosyltransferase involved in cell wall biosynthesis
LYRVLAALPGVDLLVHHVLSSAFNRPWKTALTNGYPERSFRTRFGLDCEVLRLVAKEKDSFFFLACWGDLTNQVGIVLSILLGRQYAMCNDAPHPTRKRHPVKAFLRAVFLRRAFRSATAVLATGEPAVDAIERMGCPREKLVNFPYFVDPANFSTRRVFYDARSPMVFVSAGRLVQEKGYSIALAALAEVFRDRVAQFRYLIMGVGPELDNLSRQAQSLGIGERVEFLGWLDPDEARAVYESGDVFLHPCLFEPFGVVVAEAMAAGMVVIASNGTVAALDRIRNGVNGFLFPNADVGALSRAIRFVFDHPEKIPDLAAHARQKAEEWPLSRAARMFQEIIGAPNYKRSIPGESR